MAKIVNVRHVLCLIAALGMTACSEPPYGFVEAPKLAKYFGGLVPSAGKDAVQLVSVCPMRDDSVDHWSTTILFEDGNLYHYGYSSKLNAVELEHHTTTGQHAYNLSHHVDELSDCLGTERNPGGSYRFNLDKDIVHGYVYERIAINLPFDETVKRHLMDAAGAVKAAVGEHAQFTPVEKSWGINPPGRQRNG